MTPYRQALILHGKCQQLIKENPEDGSYSDSFIRESVACGIYEHFKSTPEKRMLYAVYGVARKVNGTPSGPKYCDYDVMYMALYPPHAMKLASRELIGPDGFLMPIDRRLENGQMYKGPRFTLARVCTVEALALVARTYVQ